MYHFNEPTGENPKYPCGICSKNIVPSQKVVRCTLCNFKIHIKCNETDKKTYDILQKDKDVSTICLKCNKEIFPFFSTESNKSDSFNKQFLASDTIKLYFKGINEFNNNQNIENNDDNGK